MNEEQGDSTRKPQVSRRRVGTFLGFSKAIEISEIEEGEGVAVIEDEA